MKIHKNFVISLLIGLVFWLASCDNQDEIDPMKYTQSPVIFQPTSSPTIFPDYKTTPLHTLSQTKTPTIIIPTSLPTLSPEDTTLLVSELVATNGDCSLPCWWGIIPGDTTWQEARQQLEQYNIDISSTGPTEIEIENQKRIIDFYYISFYSNDYPRGLGARIAVLDETDITMIYTMDRYTGVLFQLHSLLDKYGKPSGVFIETNPNVPGDLLTLKLVLYYPELSLGVGYDLHAFMDGNNIVGCPKDEIAKIWMWEPERRNDFTLEYIQEGMIGYGAINSFLSLEEATGYSLDEFFQGFKDENNVNCLETSSGLWE